MSSYAVVNPATGEKVQEYPEITDSELDHSVVLEHSRIVGVHRLTDSLIGRNVEVVPSPSRPRATRLMLGDHSHVELPGKD